jgi:hypothetical protein
VRRHEVFRLVTSYEVLYKGCQGQYYYKDHHSTPVVSCARCMLISQPIPRDAEGKISSRTESETETETETKARQTGRLTGQAGTEAKAS